jgi:hypothetical protein
MPLLAIVISFTQTIHRPKTFILIQAAAVLTCQDATESLDEKTQSVALVPGRDLRTPKWHETARLEGEVCIRGASPLRVLRPALCDWFPLPALHLDLKQLSCM